MNGSEGRYLSPKQAGKVHRALAIYNISKYASGYSTQPLTISQNETWDFPMQLYRPLIIETGNTLTITCKLKMPQQGWIEVKPGAELILDGGHITKSNINAGDYWEGVHLEGNSGQPQATGLQPVITIKNGGKISHARDAITNMGVDNQGNDEWGTTGGIIHATDAIFENNRRDVAFLTYVPPYAKNQNYDAYFRNCQFIRNDQFSIESMTSSISMWQVAGVEIEGCEFKNLHTGEFQYDGNAILSINASYNLNDYEAVTPTKKSYVEGYGDAIRSDGDFGMYLTIAKTDFVDNVHSVYLSGTNLSRVAFNDVKVKTTHSYLPPQGGNFQMYGYGIYLDQCNAFSLHDNTVDNLDNVNDLAVGIVIKDAGSANVQVYKNTIDNFKYGIQALGQNRDLTTLDDGLKLNCNDLGATQTNATDIGVFGAIGRSQSPAGKLPNNLFSPNTVQWDFINYGPSLLYEYGTGNSRVKPINISGIILRPKTDPANYSNNCVPLPVPESLNESIIISDLQAAESDLTQETALRDQLIDQGSTPALEAQILFASGQAAYQDLYLELMSTAPYVSNENLLNLIGIENYPELALRNVMVANPHSSRDQEIWDALVNREPALSQQTLQDIQNETQTITSKDVLDMKISGIQTITEKYSTLLIQKYMSELPENPVNESKIKNHLLSKDEAHFKYVLANYHAYLGEYNEALNVVLAVTQLSELNGWQSQQQQDLVQYYTWLANLSDIEMTELSMSHIDFLINMATSGTGIASAKARALLKLNNEETGYVEPIEDGGTFAKRAFSETNNSSRPIKPASSFKLFPNPSAKHTILQWNWFEAGLTNGFLVQIFDMQGRLVLTKNIGDYQANTVLLAVAALNTGIYQLKISQGKETLWHAKLNIQ